MSTAFPIVSLLAGIGVLLVGSGLFGTLLALRAGLEGFADQMIGLVMSGYFVGFFAGTYVEGPIKFFELLDEWRAQGDLEGVVLQ